MNKETLALMEEAKREKAAADSQHLALVKMSVRALEYLDHTPLSPDAFNGAPVVARGPRRGAQTGQLNLGDVTKPLSP